MRPALCFGMVDSEVKGFCCDPYHVTGQILAVDGAYLARTDENRERLMKSRRAKQE
jgi:hypothetical protein